MGIIDPTHIVPDGHFNKRKTSAEVRQVIEDQRWPDFRANDNGILLPSRPDFIKTPRDEFIDTASNIAIENDISIPPPRSKWTIRIFYIRS